MHTCLDVLFIYINAGIETQQGTNSIGPHIDDGVRIANFLQVPTKRNQIIDQSFVFPYPVLDSMVLKECFIK